jgi:hypothetical protein
MALLDQRVQRLATQGIPFELLPHKSIDISCAAISIQAHRDIPDDL